MFTLHCIPISAVNRLLLHSAFPDENHMLNSGRSLIGPAPETHRPQASSSSSSSSTLTLLADESEIQES